jgi:hypothetical protein
LPASFAHFRYIRPLYFVERISVVSLILSALHLLQIMRPECL